MDEIIAVIDENDFNVTLSGGDPLMQVEGVTELARRLKEAGRNVWCYTGYTYEQVSASPRLSGVLPYIDVLVDGAFIESRRDVRLRFRGSSNQRLIDVARSEPGSPVVWGD
ncbi:MAG: radical SAM protein [Muribaculum sp.]|nr:radical SAM protein [Muribaculum sp.]